MTERRRTSPALENVKTFEERQVKDKGEGEEEKGGIGTAIE